MKKENSEFQRGLCPFVLLVCVVSVYAAVFKKALFFPQILILFVFRISLLLLVST